LKPENILLQDGQPVVSDFGIALAVTNAGGTRVTQTGLSLGTPAYMSPEQATGDRLIDARSDIYSLAAVLYEMLTGEPPHTGSTVQAIIARVLTDRVRPVRSTRDTVPENVDAALQRALAKLPADRFETAKDFAEALQDPRYTLPITLGVWTSGNMTALPGSPERASAMTRFAPWTLAIVASVIAAVSLVRSDPEPELPPPVRFDLLLPDSLPFRGGAGDLALSSDGRVMVLVVRQGNVPRIAVRSMGETSLRVLPGTDGATRVFISPDGTAAGFIADGRLRTVSLAGGGVTTLVNSGVSSRATWGDSGIVFSSERRLVRISPAGGTPVPVTEQDSAFGHASPSIAPGGRLLLTLTKPAQTPEIAVADADGRVRGLGVRGVLPYWVETGHILYNTTDGNLMALPVDRKRLIRTGDPVLIQNRVRLFGGLGQGVWTAAPNGTIVLDQSGTSESKLGIVDRSGRFTALTEDARTFRLPRLSPDFNQVAIQVGTSGTNLDSDIWIFDRRMGTLSRFTSGEGNSDPMWAPNGRRLAFARSSQDSLSGGAAYETDIFWQDVDRTSPPELVYSARGNQWPWGFTPDSKTVIFDEAGPPVRIRAADVGSSEPARDVVANEFANRTPHLSFDGKWLAYTSTETGQVQVNVRPFPGPGRAVQVSVDGGDQPKWSRDGRELYYRDGANMIAATMRNGAVTARTVLFEDRFQMSNATNYDVFSDGRFLMLRGSEELRRLTVLVNWSTELRRLTPVSR
jgi:serine/threonine-protein kinase